jgi:hypothetical protein
MAWIAFAFAGVVLASSRPLGPLWVATGVVVLVWLTGGPRLAWRRFREGGGAAVGAVVAIGVAIGASVWWELAMQPSRDWRFSDLLDWSPGLKSVPRVLRESVGVFGPVNGTYLLPLGYIGWAVVVGVLVALALRYGGRSAAMLVVAVAVAAVALTVFLTPPQLRTGFGIQGRYLLPFYVTLPLIAAEVIRRGGGSAHRALNAIALPAIGVLAAVQVVAWAQNSRRYAVGNNGPGLFALHARWSPAGGFGSW